MPFLANALGRLYAAPSVVMIHFLVAGSIGRKPSLQSHWIQSDYAGDHVRCCGQQIPHPRERIRLLLAAALAVLAILSAAVPGRAQCSATGFWQGTWSGKNYQDVPGSGPISASFTQTGGTFMGSLTVKGRTIQNISGNNTGSPDVSFTFTNESNLSNSDEVSATGEFSADCKTVSGMFNVITAKGQLFAMGMYTITNEVSVLLFDPIPGLAFGDGSEFQLSTNPELLSTNGTPVNGGEADGVTQVVVMVANLSAGQQITLSVINDQMNPSTSAPDDGGLGNLNSGTYTASSLPLTAQQVDSTYMAFAVYQPPIDFVRSDAGGGEDYGKFSRPIQLQVQDASGKAITTQTVIIFRPPILTVHGIWEDKTAFSADISNIEHSGLGGGIQQLFTCEADYNSNTATMSDAAADVLAQASLCLDDFKTNNPNNSGHRAAAGQVDVITHGSAGLAALEASAYPSASFQTTETYGKGYFHKLITLEAPYFGSIFAQQMQKASRTCLGYLSWAGYPNTPTLAAMTPLSPVVLSFEGGLPKSYAKHAIAAELDNVADDSNSADAFNGTFVNTTHVDNYINAYAPISGCDAVFKNTVTSPPDFNLNVYFTGFANPTTAQYNGANDLVTTVRSQLGLLANYSVGGTPDILLGSNSYVPQVTSFWGFIPADVMDAPAVFGALQVSAPGHASDRLQNLLDDPVSGVAGINFAY
jgi:hypothetical protein